MSAEDVGDVSARSQWTENLTRQADRAVALGRELCTCEGSYHWFWSALRISRRNDIMEREEPILAAMMRPFMRAGASVMIGGSADPGVLCAIGRIYEARKPAFTVVDKCKAPLALVDDFTAAQGLVCRTLRVDLLELRGDERWDQIVLHYTLDFIEPRKRAQLLRGIMASLAPEGTLVLATMSGAKPSVDQRAAMESAFLAHIVKALEKTPVADRLKDPEFQRQLRLYAAARTIRRLNSPAPDEIGQLLREAQFRIIDQHASPRTLVGLDVVDTSTLILAGRA